MHMFVETGLLLLKQVADFGAVRADDRGQGQGGGGACGSAGAQRGGGTAIGTGTSGGVTGEMKMQGSSAAAHFVDPRLNLASVHTHASTKRIIGTHAYMPTEYYMLGHVSEKTDSFAYGIVLVELLTGCSVCIAWG